MDVAALQAELEQLRQDNAVLQEALRLAQLGGIDLQGYLSKFNPNAAEQGIFSQDWELRYFVLSGALLKYYNSERDVGRNYRGVLSLEGREVEVEQPQSAKGPFVFQINDPEDGTLLRLSADDLDTAKRWLKTLHAVGLRVRGFRRLTAVTLPGWQPQGSAGFSSQATASLSRGFTSFSRALSGRWSSVTGPPVGTAGNSIDSELSMTLDRRPPALHNQDSSQQQQQQQPPDIAAAAAHSGSSTERKDTDGQAAPVSLQQRPSVGPPRNERQGAAGDDVITDEDDVISSDDDDVSRMSRLRRKYQRLKDRLHIKSRTNAATAAAGATAAGLDGSSGSAVAAGATPAAAAAALVSAGLLHKGAGTDGANSSSRHRRTLSAPLQKQVSWRWERLDHGDELPDAEHSSDDDSSSDISSSDSDADDITALSRTHTPPLQQQQQQQHHLQDPLQQQHQQQLLHSLHHQQHHQQVLETIAQEPDTEEPPKRPQRISAFGEATEAAAIAAAGGISDANPAAMPAAVAAIGAPGPTSAPPPAPSTGLMAAGRSGFKPPGIGMASLKPQTTGVVKPKRGPMVGCSAVHVAAKDSILTEHDKHGVMRHEGFLNLGVVVLLATNLRMIIGNLMTYGLRLKVNRAVLQTVVPLPLSADDIITLAAIPLTCLLFAAGALLIEWLGLRLLLGQEKVLRGLQKKGTAPSKLAVRGAVSSSRQEALLLLLNLLNAGGSLVLPCCLVLSNKSSLVPAFILTVVAIVMSMKLATYAHCNTTLRSEARARAVEAAAAGLPIPSTSTSHSSFTQVPGPAGRHSRLIRQLSRGPRSMLAPPGYLATAATVSPAAAAAGSNGSSDVAALRSSATDPSPFIAAGLSRTGSMSRRGVTSGVIVGDVTYPGNLNPGDLGYFLVAPTLTYQLNFPRLRQRRSRLLSRWLLLAVLTALAMGFMQVQFMLPCMQSSLVPLREMNYIRFMERLLRLSVPNTCVWLAMFYLVFHLWLNILGELLMFGDRMFYKEWWNAATLADYWKLWNIPVHKWMLRTIFFPLVRRGAPRLASLLLVFFISAVMHELAVGVPLRMLRGWAFWGMMLQVPLIIATELLRKKLKADTLGNMVFWASFCVLGQPMCLVLYYHDWLLANMGEQGWQAAATEGELGVARMVSAGYNTTLASVAGSLVY